MILLFEKTRKYITFIRLIPFEINTAEGRSNERFRRLALTALTSAFAQVVGVIAMLVSVPITLNYLGSERYGLWITISSFIAVLGFTDLGMGNGLLNAIAEANGRNDPDAAQSYVSGAFFILTGVTLLFGVIWIAVYPHVPWNWLFNVTGSKAIGETRLTLSIVVWCMLLSLPLGLVQKIQDGFQEGYVNGLWRAGASLLGLAGVLTAIYLKLDLPILVLVMVGSPVFAFFVNSILLFGHRPWLRPKWESLNETACKQIIKNGSLFFVLQLAVAVGFQSDNLVIAHFLGANQVPQYAVPMKLFMLIPSLLNLMIAPLWPAYGEAIVRSDLTWVIKTFKRSLLLSLGVSFLPSLFLVVFGGGIIEFWVGPQIRPDFVLLVGFGLWTMLSCLGTPIAMLLNGANVIGLQIIFASLMATGNLLFSIFLVQKIGISGPVYGSFISSLLFSILPLAFFLPRRFASWFASERSTQE